MQVGLAVDGVNMHDMALVEDTFASVVLEHSKPDTKAVWYFEADKAYDCLNVRYLASYYRCVSHIPHNNRRSKQVKQEVEVLNL